MLSKGFKNLTDISLEELKGSLSQFQDHFLLQVHKHSSIPLFVGGRVGEEG